MSHYYSVRGRTGDNRRAVLDRVQRVVSKQQIRVDAAHVSIFLGIEHGVHDKRRAALEPLDLKCEARREPSTGPCSRARS